MILGLAERIQAYWGMVNKFVKKKIQVLLKIVQKEWVYVDPGDCVTLG